MAGQLPCSACSRTLSVDKFSKNQRSKKEQRICADCIAARQGARGQSPAPPVPPAAAPATSGAASAPGSGHPIAAAPPRVASHITPRVAGPLSTSTPASAIMAPSLVQIEAILQQQSLSSMNSAIFQLQQENALLRAENFQLAARNAQLSEEKDFLASKVLELGLSAEDHKSIGENKEELARLRAENEQLRKENMELRQHILLLEADLAEQKRKTSGLESTVRGHEETINLLKKSYERESRLALRELLRLAKVKCKVEDFSQPAQDLLRDSKVKNDVNIAAHLFDRVRIKTAIEFIPPNHKASKGAYEELYRAVFSADDEESDDDYA